MHEPFFKGASSTGLKKEVCLLWRFFCICAHNMAYWSPLTCNSHDINANIGYIPTRHGHTTNPHQYKKAVLSDQMLPLWAMDNTCEGGLIYCVHVLGRAEKSWRDNSWNQFKNFLRRCFLIRMKLWHTHAARLQDPVMDVIFISGLRDRDDNLKQRVCG